MLQLQNSYKQIIVQAVIVYVFIFFITRIIRKKHVQRLEILDILLLLIASRTIENSILDLKQNISTSFLFVTILIAIHFIINEITFHFIWFNNFLRGKPKLIMLNGKPHKKILKKFKITEDELFEAMRNHEIMNPNEVKCAILEPNGAISIIKYDH